MPYLNTFPFPLHVTMTEHLSDFPRADEGPADVGFRQQLKIAAGMGGLLSDLGGYLRQRNEVLLEHEMGLGEYYYVQALVYHWWLGHNPIDGPELLYGLEHNDGVDVHFFDDDSNFGNSASWRRYHANVRQMLANQLAAAEADPAALPAGWVEALAAEMAALESDPDRMPWNDGLPAHITTPLEPPTRPTVR